MAAVGHPGKVEQTMFGPTFLGPSSAGGKHCGFYEGLLSHPGSCRKFPFPIPITQRSSDQGRLRAEREQEAVSSIRSLPPSSIAPSPKGYVDNI